MWTSAVRMPMMAAGCLYTGISPCTGTMWLVTWLWLPVTAVAVMLCAIMRMRGMRMRAFPLASRRFRLMSSRGGLTAVNFHRCREPCAGRRVPVRAVSLLARLPCAMRLLTCCAVQAWRSSLMWRKGSVCWMRRTGRQGCRQKREHLKPRPLPRIRHINQQSFQVLTERRYLKILTS